MTYSEYMLLEAKLAEAKVRRIQFLSAGNQIGAKQEKARIRNLENRIKEAMR